MDRKGMYDTRFLWVPKQDLRELNDLEREIEKQQNEIAKYLETRYASQWLNHFETKSKKATWAELTNDGSDYSQLSTFYGHVRSSGLERVLKAYLRYDRVGTVTSILGVDDAELKSRASLTRDLKGKLTSKNYEVRAAGFR